MKKALLMGAGGPLGPLEAGALIALDEEGVKFDVISGACIGSILALAYVSPANNMSGKEALEFWCDNSSISSLIYDFFPINYKIFLKDQGFFSYYFDEYLKNIYSIFKIFNYKPSTEVERFFTDLIILFYLSFLPSYTTYFSKGISRFSENSFDSLIDFDKLKKIKNPKVYINALNITKKQVELFDQTQITPQILAAGSSLFFLVKPQKIGNDWYAEGSYIDSINFEGILKNHSELETIVVMNILDRKALIKNPENLYEAFMLSVILPFVTIAEDDIKIFKLKYLKQYNVNLLELKFDLKGSDNFMDWSSKNFNKLKEIGYKAGKEFYKKNKELLK